MFLPWSALLICASIFLRAAVVLVSTNLVWSLLYGFEILKYSPNAITVEPKYLLERRLSVKEMFDFAWRQECSTFKHNHINSTCTVFQAAHALGTAAAMGNEAVVDDIIQGFQLRHQQDVDLNRTLEQRMGMSEAIRLRDIMLGSFGMLFHFPPHEMGCPSNKTVPRNFDQIGYTFDFPPLDLDCRRNITKMRTASPGLYYDLPLFRDARKRDWLSITRLLTHFINGTNLVGQLVESKGLDLADVHAVSHMDFTRPSSDRVTELDARRLLLLYLEKDNHNRLNDNGVEAGPRNDSIEIIISALRHVPGLSDERDKSALFASRIDRDGSKYRVQLRACTLGRNLLLQGVNLFDSAVYEAGMRLVSGCTYVSNRLTRLLPDEMIYDQVSQNFSSTEPSYSLVDPLIEGLYHAYRFSEDVQYQETAWNITLAINQTCRDAQGFHSISNISASTRIVPMGAMPGLFFGTTLRYAYLIQALLPGR